MPHHLAAFSPIMLKIMSECKDKSVFIEDARSNYCQWSQNAVELFGLESSYFEASQIWKSLLHPNDYERFDTARKRLLTEGRGNLCSDYQMKIKSGEYLWMHCNGWYDTAENTGTPIFAGVIAQTDLQNTIDPITNLKGNYDFRIALGELVEHQEAMAVFILGIDDFKEINDLYSYSFGDRVLAAFAQKIVKSLPEKVLLYRLDGDGFGLLFPTDQTDLISQYYQELQKLAQSFICIDESNISLCISGGVSLYPKDGTDSELLYRNARMALRSAKAKGKNQLVLFSDDILTKEHFKMRLLGSLRESVKMGFQGFSLKYQPLIKASNGSLYGCEALLRWKHPDFPREVSPCEFIPILEDSGLILEVGNWVFESAVKQCSIWRKIMPEFQMNINVSCRQFESPNFKFFVIDTLTQYGVPPSFITLELTESGQILDPQEMQKVFDFIRGQGIKIAFDDFGTGYASLGIFRVLSADELKIDRSFLERISYDVTDQKIITQIVNLCHSMNMAVCVEGIETPEIETLVKQFGPELLQGYYYNQPMCAVDFESDYFNTHPIMNDSLTKTAAEPERSHSMVYAPFRPAQPMSMQDVVDNAHAGIFQVGMDHEFTFLTCNEGYRRMLGYTAKEMDERFKNRALGFVHPDDMAYVNEEIRHQLSLGDTITIEFRVIRSNGTVIWILGTGNVVKSRHGGASLIVVIIENDRIKKKNLEQEQTYHFHKRILDHLATGIKCVRFDADFTIEYISPGFLAITGYTLNDIQTIFGGKYINMIYKEDRKAVINDILEQLKIGTIVTMHYRSPCKDGRLIWVETVSHLCPPDEDGIQRAYSNVVGITDAAGEQELKNRGLNVANRYQSAVEQWGDILFVYDFQSGTLSFSENFSSIFGRSCQSTVEKEMQFVHESDKEQLLEAFELVHNEQQPAPVDMRVITKDGTYRWYSLMFTLPEKLGNVPVSAIGKISDIDAEKRERNLLLMQSQHDCMTGLLNKGTTEDRARNVLANAKQGQQYVLYIIDIDDFKKINDHFGHINGDKVICEIASRIQKTFQEGDIVGRAGGDEFLAFIPYVGDNTEVVALSERLIGRLRKEIMIDQKKCPVSASIGVSRYPYDGTEFYDLFRLADSALYRAKELGKDVYCFAAK